MSNHNFWFPLKKINSQLSWGIPSTWLPRTPPLEKQWWRNEAQEKTPFRTRVYQCFSLSQSKSRTKNRKIKFPKLHQNQPNEVVYSKELQSYECFIRIFEKIPQKKARIGRRGENEPRRREGHGRRGEKGRRERCGLGFVSSLASLDSPSRPATIKKFHTPTRGGAEQGSSFEF